MIGFMYNVKPCVRVLCIRPLPWSLGSNTSSEDFSKLESLLQIPHPGPSEFHGAATHRQFPGLAVTVAVSTDCIYGLTPLGFEPAQQLGELPPLRAHPAEPPECAISPTPPGNPKRLLTLVSSSMFCFFMAVFSFLNRASRPG